MANPVSPAPVPVGWYRDSITGCLIPDTDSARAEHSHARAQRRAMHAIAPVSVATARDLELEKVQAKMEAELARFTAMNDAMEAKLRAEGVPGAKPETAESAPEAAPATESKKSKRSK